MKQADRTSWIPGPIRPKREPPTVDEAIVAAQGITSSAEEQIEIASSLIGVAKDEIRRRLRELPVAPRTTTIDAAAGRVVVVERRPSRLRARPAAAPNAGAPIRTSFRTG